tara:strand:+ start:718 stop:1872 length:1155 start_codon:yes stop_codon:yes gene_type:complete
MANHISASAAQSALSIQELVTTMKTAGMADTAIRQTLLNDLNAGGPLFGSFRNKLKNTVKNGVEASSNGSANGKFTKAGVSQFQWVSVGDGKVCPDCEERHGETGTMEYFETIGLPASGFSVCTTNCRCQLLPENYKGENLDKPLVKEKKINVNVPSMAGKHKIINDSTSWMKANGAVNVNFKTLSLDFANEITNAISKLPNKIKNNIIIGDFANFQKGTGSKFKSKSGHNYGVSNVVPKQNTLIKDLKPSFAEMKEGFLGNFNVVGFNTRKYKSLDDVTKRKTATNKAWIKSKGRAYHFNTTGEAMIHHEFGHIVQESLTFNQRNKWNEIAKKWIKKDSTEYLKVQQSFTEFYSEAFAEAWGAYQTNQKSRLPDYIVEFIEAI